MDKTATGPTFILWGTPPCTGNQSVTCFPILTCCLRSWRNAAVQDMNDMKHALVTPLLKGRNLDPECLRSYRPVSNLSFVSKLTERVLARRLTDHCVGTSIA